MDDFAVACEDKATAELVIQQINDKMTINVQNLGQINRFNGVDIEQTKHYIKLYNKVYPEKMFQRHDWIHKEALQHHNKPHIFPLPMTNDAHYQRKLENADICTPAEVAEAEFGFGYCQAVGDMIYALVTCRPDISFPIIKLSQYSTCPNRIHFQALQQLYRYLYYTKHKGIYFWQKTPRDDLPDLPPPSLKQDNNYNKHDIHEQNQDPHSVLFGAVDSDYANDTNHRKSVTGIVLCLTGGTVLYKTKFQDTIAMSSTEAEFTAAAEAGKYTLYVRSILDQLGIPQNEATTLYEDNQGALLMVNQQQPTKCTQHMDIKHFAIQQWVDQDLIRLKQINTTDNYSDLLTKATGRTIFYRHMNYILGKIAPQYCRQHLPISKDCSQIVNTNFPS